MPGTILLSAALTVTAASECAYLLWHGRWSLIIAAFGFGAVNYVFTICVTMLINTFGRAVNYPLGLMAGGLRFLVNPVRLMLVGYIPQAGYSIYLYAISLAAFLLFRSPSSHFAERFALMILAHQSVFTNPTFIAERLATQQDYMGEVLRFQLKWANLSFLVLAVIYGMHPLSFWPAAVWLAGSRLLVHLLMWDPTFPQYLSARVYYDIAGPELPRT